MLPPDAVCSPPGLLERIQRAGDSVERVPATPWGTPVGDAVLYLLLCVLPFTARAVQSAEYPDHRASRFAALADVTYLPARHLRRLADDWYSWAFARICDLAGAIERSGAHESGDGGSEYLDALHARRPPDDADASGGCGGTP